MFPATSISTLAVDAGGVPKRWIGYEKVAYYTAKDLILWSIGEHEALIRGGRNRDTGKQSTITMPSIIAINGIMEGKLANRVPHLKPEKVFARDQYICAYCGNDFQKKKLSIDHILPSSRGGETTWTNCITACTRCNMRKGDKTLDEAGMQLLYIPYTPDKAEYLILSNRRILGDQMEFLKKQIKNKNSRVLEI